MSEQAPQPTPERDLGPENPALRAFAASYLADRVMALETTPETNLAFADNLHRAIPEAMSYVVDVLAASEERTARSEAIFLLQYALQAPNPRTLATVNALLHDPDPELAAEAASWTRSVGDSATSLIDATVRQRLRVLVAQANADRHRRRIGKLRDGRTAEKVIGKQAN